jgi:hypothetical protein
MARHTAANNTNGALTTALGYAVTGVCGTAGGQEVTCDKTCDRTATNANGWYGFPLLAPAPDVERMLVADDSYTCAVTYDGGGAKSLAKQTPTDGCCASPGVSLATAAPTIKPIQTNTAHLEPDVACKPPTY